VDDEVAYAARALRAARYELAVKTLKQLGHDYLADAVESLYEIEFRATGINASSDHSDPGSHPGLLSA
jgi:hypothetical protein